MTTKEKTLEEKYSIVLEALQRISTGRGICLDYEYDLNPTEKELAQRTLQSIGEDK